jgi:hypothetical protein
MLTKTRFDAFRTIYFVNGTKTDQIDNSGQSFPMVKKRAINGLTQRLENAYGRGDHVVKIYGLVLADARTPEQRAAGFGPMRGYIVASDILFTL